MYRLIGKFYGSVTIQLPAVYFFVLTQKSNKKVKAAEISLVQS